VSCSSRFIRRKPIERLTVNSRAVVVGVHKVAEATEHAVGKLAWTDDPDRAGATELVAEQICHRFIRVGAVRGVHALQPVPTSIALSTKAQHRPLSRHVRAYILSVLSCTSPGKNTTFATAGDGLPGSTNTSFSLHAHPIQRRQRLPTRAALPAAPYLPSQPEASTNRTRALSEPCSLLALVLSSALLLLPAPCSSSPRSAKGHARLRSLAALSMTCCTALSGVRRAAKTPSPWRRDDAPPSQSSGSPTSGDRGGDRGMAQTASFDSWQMTK